MNRLNFKFLFFVFFSLFFSCNRQAEKSEDIHHDTDTVNKDLTPIKITAQNVFVSLPDRKLIFKLIEENKIEYNPDLLNNPVLVSKYTLDVFKAANFGIYGSDLSIANSFGQTQESLLFLKCVNKLATQLGVSSAFNQQLFDRIQNNESNRDTTLQIISNAFAKVEELLKTSNRAAASAIILSGCWIEGLYVSCKITENPNTESIIKAIFNHKESLENIIIMLQKVNLDEKSLFILNDLKAIDNEFELVKKNKITERQGIKNITSMITKLRQAIINSGH